MTTRTYTLLVTITDEPSAPVFSETVLADAVKGALETGIRGVVIDGIPDAVVPSVHAATVDAFAGNWLRTDRDDSGDRCRAVGAHVDLVLGR